MTGVSAADGAAAAAAKKLVNAAVDVVPEMIDGVLLANPSLVALDDAAGLGARTATPLAHPSPPTRVPAPGQHPEWRTVQRRAAPPQLQPRATSLPFSARAPRQVRVLLRRDWDKSRVAVISGAPPPPPLPPPPPPPPTLPCVRPQAAAAATSRRTPATSAAAC